MRSRPVLTIAAAAIALAACGGGDSDGTETTPPEITLLPTTTEVEPVDDGTGEGEPATTPITDDATTTVVTATPTTITTEPVPVETAAPVVTEPAPVETTAPSAAAGFELGADGLGTIPFGAEPEQTITFVTSVLGPPTADTGWLDPFEIGPCGGDRIRQVNWDQLQLEFGDVSDVVDGRDHFYAFYYGVEGSSSPEPAGLQTAEKIGAGSTVADVIAAYPGVTLLQGDEFIAPSFTVNDNLAGRMSGITDIDVVETIIGGRPCDG